MVQLVEEAVQRPEQRVLASALLVRVPELVPGLAQQEPVNKLER